MEYTKKSGILKSYVTQQHKILSKNEDWKFLEKEQIFKDILIHDSDVFEETILTEIEKLTETKTELYITD